MGHRVRGVARPIGVRGPPRVDLNTPRLVADSTGTTVWRWDQQEPFGANPADQDPDGNSVAFDLPLRLPGQRYDAETALHYNYFRDYDPSIGRYGESDPIGLVGGLNTYAYVDGDPLSGIDPEGLARKRFPRVRKCNQDERLECEKQCKPEPVRVCDVYESFARVHIYVSGGRTLTRWDWVVIKFDCRCGKCEEEGEKDNLLKRMIDYLTSPRPKPEADPLGSGSAKPRFPGQNQGFGGFPLPVPVPIP